MTQQDLDALMQAIEAEPVSLARTVALAMLAEVERLTARIAELEAANADMYRTMEDACKEATAARAGAYTAHQDSTGAWVFTPTA